jgi:flagellin-like hook-associated protein FlgL
VESRLADTENADVSQLAVEFQMRLLAINASYSVATKIKESSLLNFLE